MRVQVTPTQTPPYIPFCFKNLWTEDARYIEIVRAVWNGQHRGCQMYYVVQRLKKLKVQLEGLNLGKYSNLWEKATLARECLAKAQEALEMDAFNRALQLEEQSALEDFQSSHSLLLSQ